MTKSDKVSRNLLKQHIQELGNLITAGWKVHPTIISCSNTKQHGRDDILDHINEIIQTSESKSTQWI
jgi:GTP-binding protein EngB required for normal cell division